MLGVACFSHTHLSLQRAVSPVLDAMLEYYVTLEDTLGNKKKLFTATCNQLLCPALQLRGLLQRSLPSQHGSSGIINGLEGIFKSLFRRYTQLGAGGLICAMPLLTNSDLLSEYSSALSQPLSAAPVEGGRRGRSEGGGRGRSAVSSTRLLFDVLDTYLHGDEGVDGIEALPALFNAFLQQNQYVKDRPT